MHYREPKPSKLAKHDSMSPGSSLKSPQIRRNKSSGWDNDSNDSNATTPDSVDWNNNRGRGGRSSKGRGWKKINSNDDK